MTNRLQNTSSKLSAVALGIAAACLALALVNPLAEPARAAKKDTSTNEKWSSTIVFDDTQTGLKSDEYSGGPSYVDGEPPSVEAFIGSEAKDGDIILNLGLPPNDDRHVEFNFPFDPSPGCQLPEPDIDGQLFLQHLEIRVSEEFQHGVYGMDSTTNNEAIVPMRVLFRDSTDQLFFLNYGGGERKLCGRDPDSDNVMVLQNPPENGASPPSWTVSNTGFACLERHGGAGAKTQKCGSYDMPFEFTITPNSLSPTP